jgi:ankyrin repeat protein
MKRLLALLVFVLMSHSIGARAQTGPADARLLAAAEAGDAEAARRALAAGADVNARDSRRRTALIITGENGHSAVARVLLVARPDVNARDDRRYDALTQAAARGDHALVALLLEVLGQVLLHGLAARHAFDEESLLGQVRLGELENLRIVVHHQEFCCFGVHGSDGIREQD